MEEDDSRVASTSSLVEMRPSSRQAIGASKKIIGIICLRILVEVSLGATTKMVYSRYSNPGIMLMFCTIFMIMTCCLLHIPNALGVPLLPSIFGGDTRWRDLPWGGFKGLILPTISLAGSLTLKQLISGTGSGPGYLEMLSGIGMPVAACVQYYVMGTRVSKVGFISCCIAGSCWAMCLPILGIKEPFIAVAACFLNSYRAAATKKSNEKYRLTPGLALIVTSCLSLPFYLMFGFVFNELSENSAVAHHIQDWPNLFIWDRIGGHWVPCGIYSDVLLYFTCATMSNLIVFVLFDMASPVSYMIAGSICGVAQTTFDIFYIDYNLVKYVFFLLGIDSSGILQAMKNKVKINIITIVAFCLKCLYVIIYAVDKFMTTKKAGLEK